MKISLFDNYIWKAKISDNSIQTEIDNLVKICETDPSIKSHISTNSLFKHGTHGDLSKLQVLSKYEDILPCFLDFVHDEIDKYILTSKWTCFDYHIVQSWINMTDYGTNQDWHSHSSAHISGVFYHKTFFEQGGIIFKNPNPYSHVNIFPGLSEGVHFPPEPSTLFLFPSWLEHKTDKNKSNLTRISISFDVITYT